MSEAGCFGKVPAHGDFVWQGLPARFVTPWDTWLQETLVAYREAQPDTWLESYLRSPIWRFLLRDDALGPETWCGIVLPSVDIVGRYFPFTIAVPLPRYSPFVSTQRALEAWLAGAEQIALDALTAGTPVEEVLESVREQAVPDIVEREPQEQPADSNVWGGEAAAGTRWEDQLLSALIGHSFQAPCHWSCLDAAAGTCRFELSNGFSSFGQLFTA